MIDSATAAARFGLGTRSGDARAGDARAGDPARGLVSQLERYDPRPSAFASAPTRAQVAGGLADYLDQTRAIRQQAGGKANLAMTVMPTAPNVGQDAISAAAPMTAKNAVQAARKYAAQTARSQYLALAGARATAALQTDTPFVERLVFFWANHFAISVDKLTLIGLGGLLEVEAIRPHVLGRFSDMLLAVEQHPAMLLYLDQAQSIGPNSPAGQRAAGSKRKAGLNENLAREIMELHTLGVRTGYDQADVTEFARALTGWTVAGLARRGTRLGDAGQPGDFMFAGPLHEPGDRTIIGRRYPAAGEGQARAVLSDLATSPATARHIAGKLARHFAGDAAPATLIDRLSTSFTATGGDLPTLYRILIGAPELRGGPVKFKTPWDWSVSALRAVGTKQVEGQAITGLQNQLGQPIWKPGSPAGFDDSDASWAAPDALIRRVEAASRISERAGGTLDPLVVSAAVLPFGGTPATRAAIARADSPAQGLAMVLVAPEFMRR